MQKSLLTLPLPYFAQLTGATPISYAPAPVWRNSTTSPVKFNAMSRKNAFKIWNEARRFERETRQPGKQDGALGRNGLAVLYSLLFDFMNFGTGRLDPAQDTIAKRAGISPRSVARGLANLKAWGVVNWVRRCAVEAGEFGRAVFRQLSNAYAVLPASQWLGWRPRPSAPPPEAGTWGDHPPLPSILEEASAAARGGIAAQCAALELAPDPNGIEAALARLGRGIAARDSGQNLGFSGLPA